MFSDADELIDPPPEMLPTAGHLPRRGGIEQEWNEEGSEEAGEETWRWKWKWQKWSAGEEEEEGADEISEPKLSNLANSHKT